MDSSIKTKDEWLASIKKKVDTKPVDAESLKAESQTMEGILADLVQIPTKLHMTGTVGKVSVRPDKVNENPEHGKDGKDQFKSTMGD